MTQSDIDLRLECLRLAAMAQAADTVALAREYLNFVTGTAEEADAEISCPECGWRFVPRKTGKSA